MHVHYVPASHLLGFRVPAVLHLMSKSVCGLVMQLCAMLPLPAHLRFQITLAPSFCKSLHSCKVVKFGLLQAGSKLSMQHHPQHSSALAQSKMAWIQAGQTIEQSSRWVSQQTNTVWIQELLRESCRPAWLDISTRCLTENPSGVLRVKCLLCCAYLFAQGGHD